jgi:outer membrane protein TolC
VSTDLSLQGRAERGAVAQRHAREREQALRADDVRRTIRLGVEAAVRSLRSRRVQLRTTETAAQRYGVVVANERTKYQLGTGTLFDVILAEDRRTRTLQEHVAARVRYAQAVVLLRYRTGTLLDASGPGLRTDSRRLSTIPAADESCRSDR